jgi:hypothetical protein
MRYFNFTVVAVEMLGVVETVIVWFVAGGGVVVVASWPASPLAAVAEQSPDPPEKANQRVHCRRHTPDQPPD